MPARHIKSRKCVFRCIEVMGARGSVCVHFVLAVDWMVASPCAGRYGSGKVGQGHD